MKPSASFIGQPIRSLQSMLQIIGKNDTTYAQIIPDGIYGPETVSAVAAFQRIHGLPTTGVTDQKTWETIVQIYEDALVHQLDAQPLQITLNPGEILQNGQQHPHLYLVQGILSVLADEYDSIGKPTLTGVLDDATADALSSFQSLSSLPVTGHLDKHTWRHLVFQYPTAANRQIEKYKQ